MEPKELQEMLLEVYGKPYGSCTKLANDMGVSDVTVSRWLHGHIKIGKAEATLIKLIKFVHKAGLEWRNHI